MPMTLAEQATNECRREFQASCRTATGPGVLDQFAHLFAANFKRLCTDDKDGHSIGPTVKSSGIGVRGQRGPEPVECTGTNRFFTKRPSVRLPSLWMRSVSPEPVGSFW
jgi:hypothetical protein